MAATISPYQAWIAANDALAEATEELRRTEERLALAHAHVNAATYNVRLTGRLMDRHDAKQRRRKVAENAPYFLF